MTKCDLTYEELVEDYEERESASKYFGALTGLAVAAIAMAIVNTLEVLARIGIPIVTEAYDVVNMTRFYDQMVHLASVIVCCYIFYMWAIQTVYVYRDEIEDFGKRWKKFKLFEKKSEKMEEDL
jgi:hypothetical protein